MLHLKTICVEICEPVCLLNGTPNTVIIVVYWTGTTGALLHTQVFTREAHIDILFKHLKNSVPHLCHLSQKSLETPLNACWCSSVKLMVGGLTLSVALHFIAYRLKHLWPGIAYLPSRHRHGKQCVPRRSSHTQFSLRLCLPPLAHTGTHAGRHTHK